MVFALMLLGVALMTAAALGVCDLVACIPYLPDRFAECRGRLLRGLVLTLLPAVIALIPLLTI